jgi:fucose permease
VDASLNNYVALHYKSRHMSWLHCMWGIGASLGPSIMGYAIAKGQAWNTGYRWIGYIQLGLTAVLLLSLPLWHEKAEETGKTVDAGKVLSLREILRIPGAKAVMVTFFCYCALEQTAGLWASSYLALHWNVPAETAASFAGMFYIGITIGRAVSGFLTFRLSDTALVRLGQGVIAIGGVMLAVPVSSTLACIGLIVIGLGCAPVYPFLLHSTPTHFGRERSQAVFGVQMASAYIGSCLMPPLFGLLAQHMSIVLFPFYLLAILLLMVFMHERLIFQTSESR